MRPPELLFASCGGVGHGRNDLAVGPDRKLYSIHGDSVDLPTEAIDYTSPFREARRGKKTSEGHLLRIDPESGDVELLAAGLRNPFGIDFNSDGEIFTYDADAEYDMGSPWYRPTRVSQLLIGGDYGWRGVTKQWPSYYPDHPDNTRPNLDIGKGSPTAVKFGTRSNFPCPIPRLVVHSRLGLRSYRRRSHGPARQQLSDDRRDVLERASAECDRPGLRTRWQHVPGDRRSQNAVGAVSRSICW